MLPRTLLHSLVIAPRKSPVPLHGVTRSTFRVLPTDLDILFHMNNGKYLSLLDVARFELIARTGTAAVFKKQGWYPVVVAQTISYRKSLNPWMKFAIESSIIGFDDQAFYIEQRFVRLDDEGQTEVYARAIVRGRALKRSGGVVSIAEILEHCNARAEDFNLTDDILEWGQRTRLPSTRASAPSDWPSPVR